MKYEECPECGHEHGLVCPKPCLCMRNIKAEAARQRRQLIDEDKAAASGLCTCPIRRHNVAICTYCSKPYHKDGSAFAGRYA